MELPIVCISLDRRPDRWEKIQNMANEAHIRISKLSAVDASTFVAHKHPDITLGTAHNILFKVRRSHYEIDTPGAIGCSLSHFKAWNMLLASSSPAMVVFEDDVIIPRDFKARCTTLLSNTPPTWDVIQLQNTDFGDGEKGCKPIPGEYPWHFCTSLMGTYGYIVSRSGAEKLLSRAYPIELHVDAYMAYMSRMGYCKMLWNPILNVQTQDNGHSNIDHGTCTICNIPSNMEKHWVIALPFSSIMGIMSMAAIVGGIVSLTLSKKRLLG